MFFDVTVIGAGTIGISIAHLLSKKNYKVLLIDKEKNFGLHTSSRNTEIIHAGIYYKPNSLKAKMCIEGKSLLYNFCDYYKVPYKKCGKIFLGYNNDHLKNFESIISRAELNGLNDLYEISSEKISSIEPNIKGKYFLRSPSSGIFDSQDFMQKMLNIAVDNDLIFSPNTELNFVEDYKTYNTLHVIENKKNRFKINSKIIINCAGNFSISLFEKIFDIKTLYKPNPIKGNYLTYSGKALFENIIYPPLKPGKIEPRIDAISDMNNIMKFGPDVEQVTSLEDYTVNENIKTKFYNEISKYLKNIEIDKLNLAYSGIRPKIKYKNFLHDDFVIEWYKDKCINLFGMDSPALTSSLAIAKYVNSMIDEKNK
tara:strand:+ start:13458 stop:14564 length:1107 start_codon:yes stop_codon:yes gene_type:complete